MWVVEGPRVLDEFASIRYMATIPARELGEDVVAFSAGQTTPDAFLDRYRPRVIILNKAFTFDLVQLAEAAKARGIKVLCIFCDWHFDKPQNRALSQLADKIIVQTATMASAVAHQFGREAVLIEEAYEEPRGAPRFVPGKKIRAVWYGSSGNLDTLSTGLRQLAAIKGRRISLTLVTDAAPDQVAPMLHGMPEPNSEIRVEMFPWSLEKQWRVTRSADVILLPSSPDKEKIVKGHNRLVQAIHAGRLALAYPLPQYLELGDYCWCGEDMADGFNWALANRQDVRRRLVDGQAYIDTRFSPKAVAARWREEIGDYA
jgi:hypothetical protein